VHNNFVRIEKQSYSLEHLIPIFWQIRNQPLIHNFYRIHFFSILTRIAVKIRLTQRRFVFGQNESHLFWVKTFSLKQIRSNSRFSLETNLEKSWVKSLKAIWLLKLLLENVISIIVTKYPLSLIKIVEQLNNVLLFASYSAINFNYY
jgi:hypothetical protein